MKKIYLFILGIFLITLVSASLGTFKLNECVDIKTILNATSVNISTLNYPNSSLIISNRPMTKTGLTFNYTFCNTSVIGKYNYDYYDNLGNVYVNDFEVTKTGDKVSLSNSILVIAFLIVAILLFVYGYTIDKDKYILKSGIFLFSLLMGLLAINTAGVIASESMSLSIMSTSGLILTISVISIIFLYIFITWTIQTFKQVKDKKEIQWRY